MENKNISKKIFFFLTFLLGISNLWAIENISLDLISDKQIYSVGENINLTLVISNQNQQAINGEIKGNILIGDVGYEIECFEYTAPANQTNFLGLTPLPASLSNSNRKTMSTLYACGGTQMQSTRTLMDNSPISQTSQETFELGPFTYNYSLNGKNYQVESNILNITVVSQFQQQSQQEQQDQSQQSSNQEQNSQSQDQNTQQNSQNQPSQQNPSQTSGSNPNQNSNPNDQSLSQQNQQALSNNQQNAQSVNQLRQEIENAKLNPIDEEQVLEKQNNFLLYFLIFLVLLLILILAYFKFSKKQENILKEDTIKPENPKYIKLLNQIKTTDDEKEKAKFLSQAIKTYIAYKNNIKIDLTHSKASKLTSNELFIDILSKTEKIEFANKKLKLDYNDLIKKIKNEFKNSK